MRTELKVDLHHLTRVEGHGNVVVEIQGGRVVQARWDVVETPRFFEVMLKGKHYTTAGVLTARICGICSIGHCLASLRATERAFGVELPPAAARLRLLAKHGETLQSHALHLFFLALPDLVGQPSVLPLLEARPDLVRLAARLKGLANRLCDAVAGRTTHPVSLQVGGVAARPAPEALASMRDELLRALGDLRVAVDLFKALALPGFVRETEFVSLKGVDDYPFIGGDLVSSDGVLRQEDAYLEMTNEYVDANNTSKWCKLSRASFAVGALARCNNNFALLHPEAARVAAELGLAPVCHNPYMNNVAQLVECVHVAHDAARLIEAHLDAGDEELMAPVTPRAGEGVGAVEVPRGVLYHHYVYDDRGRIERADCVIPTTQNNANIHHDIAALAAERAAAGTTDAELGRLCAMLVRAYDPCVSCSVH